MVELRGKYNSCKVFTDVFDSSLVGQLTALMNQECIKDSKIRIMPDCHSGKASVVGTTMTITDKVIPNIVGGDIGCGVLCVKLKEKRIDLPKFDSAVKNNVPSGAEVNKISKQNRTNINIDDLICYKSIAKDEDYCYRSVGTLGGGNHFISLESDCDGVIYLLIHTGSRYLGQLVCNFYQKVAYEQCCKALPYELSYVSGEYFDNYNQDMKMTQQFAADNRKEIARTICKEMNLHVEYQFDTVHNYIEYGSNGFAVLRKGAVSAKNGESLIIPMNMRDGSLICTGKGNEDWNMSAPHGAGRLLSRSDAKNTVGMKEYKDSMRGIYTTSVNRSTVDESPMVYKDMNMIVEAICDTVDIKSNIKPIYNFKASRKD